MNPPAIGSIVEQVILVDELDRDIGSAEKLQAHRSGKLHRAFSVFVVDKAGRLLLQKRAMGKYHSGGLWSNTCCGHPRPGETVVEAAQRRLFEEMGFTCSLQAVASFRYKARVTRDLWEHEIDHVLVGAFDGTPNPNPSEAAAWRWCTFKDVYLELQRDPDRYTAWFEAALEKADAALPAVSYP